MDKNPDIEGFKLASKHCLENVITSLLCSDPFSKSFFLKNIIEVTNQQVHYLDFDLLYSGYIESEMLELPSNVILTRPKPNNLLETWANVIETTSKSKSLLIIDSLNGFFNWYDKESARVVNSFIMLLASIAKNSQSSIIVASVSKYKQEEGWTLAPTGRQVIKHKQIVNFVVKNDDGVTFEIPDRKKEYKKIRLQNKNQE